MKYTRKIDDLILALQEAREKGIEFILTRDMDGLFTEVSVNEVVLKDESPLDYLCQEAKGKRIVLIQ